MYVISIDGDEESEAEGNYWVKGIVGFEKSEDGKA